MKKSSYFPMGLLLMCTRHEWSIYDNRTFGKYLFLEFFFMEKIYVYIVTSVLVNKTVKKIKKKKSGKRGGGDGPGIFLCI